MLPTRRPRRAAYGLYRQSTPRGKLGRWLIVSSRDTEHGIECACGVVLDTPERFRAHVWNERAQAWIEENLGDPFAGYHRVLVDDPHGAGAYSTVAAADGIDHTNMTRSRVKESALRWARDSLGEPNSQYLLEHTPDDTETADATGEPVHGAPDQ